MQRVFWDARAHRKENCNKLNKADVAQEYAQECQSLVNWAGLKSLMGKKSCGFSAFAGPNPASCISEGNAAPWLKAKCCLHFCFSLSVHRSKRLLLFRLLVMRVRGFCLVHNILHLLVDFCGLDFQLVSVNLQLEDALEGFKHH